MRDIIIVAIGLMIIGFAIAAEGKPTPAVTIRGVTFAVVVADALDERLRGLSGREALAEGEGMWFVFDKPGLHAIWMKDMRFSIDVLWLDDTLRVIHIEERLSPDSYPEVFKPRAPARYVLEVPAGAIEQYSFRTGDLAWFSP